MHIANQRMKIFHLLFLSGGSHCFCIGLFKMSVSWYYIHGEEKCSDLFLCIICRNVCHTALVSIDLLKYTFDERIISRNIPMNLPQRSFNLTPFVYFLWGYVMSLVNAIKLKPIDNLETFISNVNDNIRHLSCPKIRLPESHGGHKFKLILIY